MVSYLNQSKIWLFGKDRSSKRILDCSYLKAFQETNENKNNEVCVTESRKHCGKM